MKTVLILAALAYVAWRAWAEANPTDPGEAT